MLLSNLEAGWNGKEYEEYSVVKTFAPEGGAVLDVVCVDCEYTQHFFVSLQIYVPRFDKRIFVVNKRLYTLFPDKTNILNNLKAEFSAVPRCCDLVLYLDLDHDGNDNLNDVLLYLYKQNKKTMPKEMQLLFYYSPKDLYACFGFDKIKKSYLEKIDEILTSRLYLHERSHKRTSFQQRGGVLQANGPLWACS